MFDSYLGEMIAFGTVLCWTLGSQFFEAAGKGIGAHVVNLIRLVMAFVLFCITLFITRGSFIPFDFPIEAWLWLWLSGIIGFSFGDLFLFRAFVEIGPRVSMLIMSLAAPLTAVIGWIFLHERYSWYNWGGMLVTLSGVAMVILERSNGNGTQTNPELRKKNSRMIRPITAKGLVFGFLGMVGQAIGYVFSKVGMKTEYGFLDPFAATQIRIIAGTLGFVVFFSWIRLWPQAITALKNRKAMSFTLAGSFLGPFLGVSLSLMALHYISTGIATTILSLVPVFLIPFSLFLHKEHVSWRGGLGALIAFAGIILLAN